jgi:hypothetical protein
MKKPINKKPPAGTGGDFDRANDSNSDPCVFNNITESDNICQDTPEVNWLIQGVNADKRGDAAKANGNKKAVYIAEQERQFCGSMHNGTAIANDPYLYDADPITWGDK